MSENGMTPRERVLSLFAGEAVDRPPAFSGMGNVTVHGLAPRGWRFADLHTDAVKMAEAAISTHNLFGLESVVVPFDMGVEAEVLGCRINFYTYSQQEIVYPTIAEKLGTQVDGLHVEAPAELRSRGRVALVMDAVRRARASLNGRVPVGAWVLGPFTLAGQIVELDSLLKTSFKKPALVNALLVTLADVQIQLARLYREAGADYITVREMGATSDVLNPRMFQSLILPHLQRIFASIDPPRVLHICGDTNPIVELMAQSGAEAISVDQKNDIAATVKRVGDRVLVFGNLDPYAVLVTGSADVVRAEAQRILEAGVDALWPGCDIWPSVPADNMRALMEVVRSWKPSPTP